MVIRLYPRWLLSLALLVIAACGTEEPYDELGIKQCSVHDETMCGNIYTEDLFIPHDSLYKPVMNMVTTDALRDYLLQKENVSKTSPFRTIGDGKGDLQDLLHGIRLVKTGRSINPLFALSLSALESKWGMSRIAKNKYNLWGFNAADGREHRASKFESFTHGFNHVFRFIQVQYLHREGKYHKQCSPPKRFSRYVRRGGCPDKHCGASLAGMNCKYSSDPNWAKKIRTQMNHIAAFIKARCQALRKRQAEFPHIDEVVFPKLPRYLPDFPSPRPLLFVTATQSCG